MAQLKDTIVQGSLRATDTIFTNKAQFSILNAPTASNGTSYGPGTNNQVLRSNATSVYWASLGAAADKGVTDKTSATAIGNSDTNLITARAVYYGLPTINNAHNYTSSTTIYAPTGGGTAGQYLKATGATSTPTWETFSKSTVGLGKVENTKLSTWAGSTNITTLGTVSTGTWNATAIAANKGGTGQTSYTVGDILYASSSSALSKLNGNTATTKKFLSQTGSGSASAAPSWAALSASDIPNLNASKITEGTFSNDRLTNKSITIAGTVVNLGSSIDAATLRTNLNLTTALRFIGKTTSTMTDGFTGVPAGINNYSVPIVGDVVLDSSNDSEYVCISVSGTTYTWERLGRDSSWALDNAVIHNNLITTKGDIIYASAANTPARLAGNTTTTRKFLRSVATTSGTANNPEWDTLVAGDIPDLSATYLPLTSGTLSNSLIITKAAETSDLGLYIIHSSKSKSVALLIDGITGTRGLYDVTQDRWIVSSDSSGNVLLNGTAATVSRATFGDANNGERDANNITSNGLYYYTSNGPSTTTNLFKSTDGAIYCQAYSTSWVAQIAQDYRNGALAVRGKNNGTWQEWLSIPTMKVEGNYPTLLPSDGINNWIKIGTANTNYGLIPSQSGTAGNGHNYIGTRAWYWKQACIDEIITGNINIWPQDLTGFSEGIRIHEANDGWCTIMLCGSDNTEDIGTSTNSWGIFNYNGTLYINKGAADAETTARAYADSNGWHFTKAYGAVWNDYAEFRKTNKEAKAGQVVIDNDDGSLSITDKRLMSGAQIVSDTFGFSIGESEEAQTPLAVSGRVLVYTYRPREEYHAGMAVCSAPNGTIDIMTREEIQQYPDAIIGIVSEIPDYEEWGTGKVKVNGRIWIKIK